MESPNIKYIPGVDHLRAFAAVLILLYHGVQLFSHREMYDAAFDPGRWLQTHHVLWSPIVEGHTAVGLFMVLSGFIFAWGTRDSEINYWIFLKNRFLRIFPLFVCLTVAGVYIHPDSYSLRSLVQTLLLQANLPGALSAGAFSAMFWAISVEFQFYLIFPFLMLFSRRYGVRYLIGIIALFTLFRLLAYLARANVRDIGYWTIVGRMDQFALGMIAALRYAPDRFAGKAGTSAAALALGLTLGLALASLHAFHLLGGWPAVRFFKIFWPTWEGVIWALVIMTYLPLSHRLPRTLSQVLCGIGTMSFSIYLVHFLLLVLLANQRWYFPLPFFAPLNALINTVVIVLPLSLLASALTYNCIERPFLEMRGRYKKAGSS